ncbi:MAG: acetolactate synthase small subunit [Acidobacteriota bacterium]
MIKKYTLSALVENKPGVLNRVVSLFRRRNFNIDSLTVGRTENPELSRMTILIEGTEAEAYKVEKMLYKLPNVVHVEHLHDKPVVVRDLALIKVRVDSTTRPEVMQLCNIFRARVVDVAKNSLVAEVTGPEEKIESFVNLLKDIGIIEMVRTGIVAMGRGDYSMSPRNEFARTAARASKTVI